MDHVVSFDGPAAVDKAVVGGKGANLGKLVQAGFPAPPGFCLTTRAYDEFVAAAGLDTEIAALLAGADYGDADDVETRAAKVRDLFLQTTIPPTIADAISTAYRDLGDDVYVAVRSSGTAEDLAEASFAGLHDTLLDIRGARAVLNAVRTCWASLWTGRATAYRHNNGFDHSQARLSVVIQEMIESDASGVMFTANPLTTATNEVMIDSSWGLGEAIVQGAVTPDQYLVRADDLQVRAKTLGTKTFRVRRAPDAASGALTDAVPEADQARFTLTDAQAGELAQLGLRVQEYYGGLPQDIEWAIRDGRFHVLQSRPVTGVEFSWDADCEDWQNLPEEDDVVWTRSLADENWTGAISPLMYSWRAPSWVAGHEPATEHWGLPELRDQRFWKFHKATAYFNCNLERDIITKTIPPALRAGLMANIPALWRDDVAAESFSWIDYLKLYARVEALQPQLYKGFRTLDGKWRIKHSTEGKGLPDADRRKLSDRALKRYVDHQIDLEDEYNHDLWTWFFVNARDVLTSLSVLVRSWYGDDDPMAFQALLTGVPEKSETMKANHMLWEMSHMIRNSADLRAAFDRNTNEAFFAACEKFADGSAFLDYYRGFIELYGQRGHPDRDIYFPRRCEDPSIDYSALASMLSTAESVDPEVKERENNTAREAFAETVIEKIRRGPFGSLKAEIFKVVYAWSIRFVIARDNERNFLDHTTLSIRLGFLEIARRLVERGVFESVDDVWFLTRLELYAVLDSGQPLTALNRAKITARRRDFERMLNREVEQPKYLINDAGADLDAAEDAGEGVLRGIGTAKGTVTATAKVVRKLADVGKVAEGDILVVNSTDPGWTPVFHIISGIVLETGGILAHGSCLAREYGLPAVQIPSAMRLIPDGATITINGDHGSVKIIDQVHSEAESQLAASNS